MHCAYKRTVADGHTTPTTPIIGKQLCTSTKSPNRLRRHVQWVPDDLPLVIKRPEREVHPLPRLMSGTTWCVQVLRSPKEAFAAATKSWRERCEKCVCLQGDYTGK